MLKLIEQEIPYVREICLRSFYEFVVEFWPIVEHGRELVANWHIKYLCDQLQARLLAWERGEPARHLIINVSPGETKSTLVSQMFDAWGKARNPGARCISSSHSSTLSTKNAVRTRDILQSDMYRQLFADTEIRKDVSGKTYWNTTLGGTRISTSVGSSVVGEHADYILIDDPLKVDPRETPSDADIESASNYCGQVLVTRTTNKETSFIVLIMQRLHEADPTAYLAEEIWEEDEYDHIVLPATNEFPIMPAELEQRYTQDGPVKVMNPQRTGHKVCLKKRRELGPFQYAAQFGQQPKSLGGTIIKEDWLKQRISLSELETRANAMGQPLIWHSVLDGAYTGKEDNSASGQLVFAILGGKLYLRAAMKFFEEFPDLTRKFPEFLKSHGAATPFSYCYVEPKGPGLSIIQEFKVRSGLNVIADDAPSHSKEMRAYAITGFVEAGNVVLVDGWDWTTFIDDVTGFPNVKHTEFMDLLVMASNKVDWLGIQDKDLLFPMEDLRQLTETDYVKGGKSYITARIGKSYTEEHVIALWNGWRLEELIHFYPGDRDPKALIRSLARKHAVTTGRIMYHNDGAGRIKSFVGREFVDAAQPPRQRMEKGRARYKHLLDACVYHLSNKVQQYEVFAALNPEEAQHLYDQLHWMRKATSADKDTLAVTPPESVKEYIGRLPDRALALAMRSYFDLRSGTEG